MAAEPSPFDSVRIFAGSLPQPEQRRSPQPAPAPRPAPAAKDADAKRLSEPSPVEPVKCTTAKAADLCARFPLSEPAALLLTGDLTPQRYLDLLTEKNLYADATRLLAHGLPKRAAVWWACQCLREALGSNPPLKARLPLEVVEKWVQNPSEDNRRAGLPAAETAGFGTPVGLTALAAFWSGGSLTPPDAPVIPPADHLTAEGVAGAVLLAAVGAAPDDVPKRQRRFLDLGMVVACGK